MDFGMKRVFASVQAIAALKRIYTGEPVSIATLSKEAKLSTSYLEQIFQKLRTGNLVCSHRGPGGGYSPRDGDITVSEVIRAVSHPLPNGTMSRILEALDGVLISELTP